MSGKIRILVAAALAATLVLQTGCVLRRERIADQPGAAIGERSETIALEGATEGAVEIMLGAGKLQVASGADAANLAEGDFEYRPPTLAPIIEPSGSGTERKVLMRQGRQDDFRRIGTGLFQGDLVSDWEVRLSEAVPLDLIVSLGAGEGDLDLRGVDIERLRMDCGAGDVTVDLSGERSRDIRADVQAGAGEITLRFPRDVGVRVMGAQDGVGSWNADGFVRDGNYYANDAYATSDVKIDVDVQRGVGDVTLELVD